MKDLNPNIYRQRLIIEGFYTRELNPYMLRKYMKDFSKELGMRIIYGPIAKNLAGKVNPIHKGFECIMIWVESGASIYIWEKDKFFTVDVYSCKKFSAETAVSS